MIKNVLVGEDSVTIEQSILKAEYDPLYNAIRLFRLYELENTTPNLIKTIEETFKWTQSCELDMQTFTEDGCTDTSCEGHVCLWNDALSDRLLQGRVPENINTKAVVF